MEKTKKVQIMESDLKKNSWVDKKENGVGVVFIEIGESNVHAVGL